MKQLNLVGIITATSNKQSEKFKSENPRKSVYLKLDPKQTELAIAFGLREYGKEDKFFIVKASESVTEYNKDAVVVKKWDGGTESNNFNSDNQLVSIAIIEGQSDAGNKFYRAFAVQGELNEVVPENPFSKELPF